MTDDYPAYGNRSRDAPSDDRDGFGSSKRTYPYSSDRSDGNPRHDSGKRYDSSGSSYGSGRRYPAPAAEGAFGAPPRPSTEPFVRNFYQEHPSLAQVSDAEIDAFRREHAIVLRGQDIPKYHPLKFFLFARTCVFVPSLRARLPTVALK